MHKDLIPVSIKLKSTIKTEKAKTIIRKAEKDLLQARVNAINSILDNVSKQTELCRSQLAPILSAQRLRECQGFIEKVGEIRLTKVKQRQLNKFNNLLNKKEGNITGVSIQLNSSQGLVTSQAGRQASAQLPLGEGGSLSSQAGRQSGANLPFGEGSSLASQAGRQAATQAVSHLPRDSTSSQAGSTVTPNTPAREGPSQAGNNPPSNQAGSQVATPSGKQSTRCSARHRAPRLPRGIVLHPR